jgi:preprotein translocase subunit SecE
MSLAKKKEVDFRSGENDMVETPPPKTLMSFFAKTRKELHRIDCEI